MKKLLFLLTGRLPCRLIKVKGQPYLERYYLFSLFGITFYLHRFLNGDGDEYLHDHPFKFSGSLVLAGYYHERSVSWLDMSNEKFRHLKPGKVNLIGPHKFHQILFTEPDTWTLFWHAKRVKSWGFLMKGRTNNSTIYVRPYEQTSADWHKDAPRGCDAGREPFVKR